MFDHIISLGWFCSPALEIRRIGLRDASYPFDWLMTHDFSVIINLIKNKRYIKLHSDDMLQYESDSSKWYSREYLISIFHDFDNYTKLNEQIGAVNEKYFRRMKRFYESIIEPTLFLRYIKDEDEALYISTHEVEIKNVIQEDNEENEIIYIANIELKDALQLSKSKIYFVTPDSQDYVARSFLRQLPDLYEYLQNNVKKPRAQKSSNTRTASTELKKMISKWRKPVKNGNEIHREGYLERKQSDQIVLFHDFEDCSGCGACAAICPRKAIKMVLNHDFYYPTIDKKLCISCKICLNICPFK